MNGDLFEYALRLGDDALVLAQRLAAWCAHAPEIEEDVALANVALDLLGQARELLAYAGEVEGAGRDEDDLAYLRDEHEFRNALIVEHENGDFAVTIVRQLLFSAYQLELYPRLERSRDERLAGVAAKAAKEVAYHVDHAGVWTLRLGDGTEESRARAQAALERLWPYAHELFEPDAVTGRLAAAGVGVDPAELRPGWERRVGAVLAEATLEPPPGGPRPSGGRAGRHTEAMGYLLAELQHLHRSHPGVAW
ncbi:MAG TPA: 1,2-phenylacetyl-CoA epoxidase subunit PaaC [Gaiellaceae bacterium]|nr:1,2-phenylacetyl-CoA epoxidase subunit PaaC [Gaiellaceae bacterium]